MPSENILTQPICQPRNGINALTYTIIGLENLQSVEGWKISVLQNDYHCTVAIMTHSMVAVAGPAVQTTSFNAKGEAVRSKLATKARSSEHEVPSNTKLLFGQGQSGGDLCVGSGVLINQSINQFTVYPSPTMKT